MTLDRQPTLEGELVRLRPLEAGDFDALWTVASDPLTWEQHPSKDRSQQDVFRRWFDGGLESGGALAIVDRADGRVIGTSRLDHYGPARREVEIGWTLLARSHWGGPYNADAKRLLCEHAFRTVDVVVFRVHVDNRRSQRAVEKLGAVRVRTEPDAQGRGDSAVFELLPPGDEHTVEVAAGSGDVWHALTSLRLDSPVARVYARAVGCRDTGGPVTGFHVAREIPQRELVLAGRHRFSRYVLRFRVEELDPSHSRLRAETRAVFPGGAGAIYRALVLRSGAHVRGVHRLLADVERRS